MGSEFLDQELKTHFQFLEDQLASAPDGGPFLCGSTLTAADVQMSIPAQAAAGFNIITPETHPKITAYVKQIEDSPGYRTAVKKIEEIEGKPFVPI